VADLVYGGRMEISGEDVFHLDGEGKVAWHESKWDQDVDTVVRNFKRSDRRR